MIIYIDLDDTICNYTQRYNELKDEAVIVEFPQSAANFYDFMEPIDGAIEAVKALARVHEVYILTAPSYYNPLTYTGKAKWVARNIGAGFVKNLIICNNKGLLRGNVLIDDHTSGRGQENFQGQLIKFSNWQELVYLQHPTYTE